VVITPDLLTAFDEQVEMVLVLEGQVLEMCALFVHLRPRLTTLGS